MATVLVTGGTGLIGTALTRHLAAKGHQVIVLTRKARSSKHKNVSYAVWDVEAGIIDEAAIKKADCIMHLAGANVAEARWTANRKKQIRDSRVQSGALLVKALQTISNKVTTFIAASATGWYGPDPQIPNPRPFSETALPATNFLGTTCQQWEESVLPVVDMGIRLVQLRTGIVLSNRGGAYAEFKKPMRFGVATILGSGKQIVSWIHIEDIAGIYQKAMEDEKMQGVYNAVTPQPTPHQSLIKTMAKQKGGVLLTAPVPAAALKIGLGEMSTEVLKSVTVSSKKIEEAGYQFLFPTIETAVYNLEKQPSY